MSCSLIIRAITAGASYDMRNLGLFSCAAGTPDAPTKNKYYLSRAGKLIYNTSSSFTGAEGCIGCAGSGGGGGQGSSMEIWTPVFTENGNLLFDYSRNESWESSYGDTGSYTEGIELCNCDVVGSFTQSVKEGESVKNIKISENTWPTPPTYISKRTTPQYITCKKRVSSQDQCTGEDSGYEYLGPEVEADCLSDAGNAFYFCNFCGPCGYFCEPNNASGPCGSFSNQRSCSTSKQELDWDRLHGFCLASVGKQKTFKNVSDSSLNSETYFSKWSHIGSNCGSSIRVYHKKPNAYVAVSQSWQIEIITPEIASFDNKDKINLKNSAGANGKLIFTDVLSNQILKEISFSMSGGKASLGELTNEDSSLAPESPEEFRDVSMSLIIL